MSVAPTAAAVAADAQADTTSATSVAEVVVTVQKREQLLQNVPATATALTASTLSQAGGRPREYGVTVKKSF